MKTKILITLLVLLCLSSSAYAIPVAWTFQGGATTGGFTYDSDTNTATDVNFTAYGQTFSFLNTAIDGPVLGFDVDVFTSSTGSGIFGTTLLGLGTAAGLTNAGGIVNYAALYAGFPVGLPPIDFGQLAGTSTVEVPEPSTMALLGLGLLGLGWTRRKVS